MVNFVMKRYILIFIPVFLFNYIYAECSDLDSTECLQWAEYCEWNEDVGQCQEIGGGGDTQYGPYQFSSINESNGLRNGPDYTDGVLYYPIDADPPYGSVVLTPGWDSGGSSWSSVGEF